MSPAGVSNHVKHTLQSAKFHMHTWRQDNKSDNRAQKCKGHTLSTKTLRSHVTRDYTVFIALGQGK